ncbi:P-loop containing nucleoside triphosphate hydrolase protein, partial [Ilyonectria destructans]
MDDLDLAAESLADKVQRFSAFIGVTKPTPRDKFFLVMGMTGSGKSTFVARCTGHAVTVGHGLYSCTNSIDVFKFSLKGRNIYLIDTPGFNDTNRSDIDTLGILAAYLGASYANGVRIHGIILLHPISDNRISGSSLRNIEMLKAVCGFTSYDNLAIATTMWPDGPALDEKTKLEQRETELVTDERFFGSLVARGAKMFRHKESDCRDNGRETASAHCILIHLIHQLERSQPSALHLQREIIDQGKALSDTAAGIVAASYLHKARCEHEHRLKELKAEM